MQRTITATELQTLLDRGVPLTLCDVRRAEARAKDPVAIPGTTWFDPALVDDWGTTLTPGIDIVVYCVHGHEVSNSVVDTLQAKGLNARLIDGGIEAWKAAGGAVEVHA